MAGILFSTDIPLRNPALTQVLVGGYVLWAIGLTTAAWFDWWYDCRLAPTAQFIDFTAFSSAIYFMERPQGVLTGPFLVFGTFLLLVALVRWGQRGVAATTAGLILAAIVPAAILTFDGAGPNPLRFMRGVICMIVVSMLMLWLASRQRGVRVVTLPDPSGAPGHGAAACCLARCAMPASRWARAVRHWPWPGATNRGSTCWSSRMAP
ncbi:hypothetical protein ACFS32_10390 [Novosphingobium pokkalii]|uniref:hypothetical protein n=1 Tax=Novosphingobium pokkalii TaxID=1770194 RepID=UPI0036417AEA